MPDPAPLNLTYTPYDAGTLSWQRDRDLLLLTIYPPPAASPFAPANRRHTLVLYTTFLLASLAASTLLSLPAPLAACTALGLTAALITLHLLFTLLTRLLPIGPTRRHLLIRVNRHKLLIDEAGQPSGHDGIHLSLTGRSWSADEITSVTAQNSSLRIQTRTRRLPRMPISGYAPADLTFAADAIRKVLAEGVDAWTQSQQALPTTTPAQQQQQ